MTAKRVFDLFFTIVTSPFWLFAMLVIAILIKIDSKGRVIFVHPRVGKGGKTIYVLKFRTMYEDAPRRLQSLLSEDPLAMQEWERYYKLKNDPRITKIGRILRKTSLDELPQFINILKGDMSLVGPRPVTQEELDIYYRDRSDIYKKALPGLTGLWQVSGRNDLSYEERVALDCYYIKHQSLIFDLKIIIKTFIILFTAKGSY